MNETKLFEGREIKSLIIGGIVLGFIFSFREWGYGQLNLSIGITNLIRYSIISIIVLLVYQSSHKLIAKKYGAISSFRLWNIKRYWFSTKSKVENLTNNKIKSINTGIIIPILLALLSNGYLKFAAVGSSEVTSVSKKRLGKKFKHLTGFELAQIHLVGPLTLLLVALILNQFAGFEKVVEICYLISIFSMIPFSGLDGSKIFFGSLGLYVFGLTVIIGTIILMQFISPLLTALLAVVVAFILLVLFLNKTL